MWEWAGVWVGVGGGVGGGGWGCGCGWECVWVGVFVRIPPCQMKVHSLTRLAFLRALPTSLTGRHEVPP